MNTFEHIVLTRFNVRLFDDGSESKGTNPDWLQERFRLFDTYCYPSLLSQSNQNFKWLVLFDEKTPEPFKTRAISAAAKWKNYIPEFVNFSLHGETGCPPGLRSLIEKHVLNHPASIITTRIDNDDAVSKQFIQLVQDHARSNVGRAIVFPVGYQLFQGRLYLDFSIGNHFISLIEQYEPGRFQTVFTRSHDRLYEVATVKKILCRPTWLEVVHGGNRSNRPKEGLEVSPRAFFTDFGVGEAELSAVNQLALKGRQAKFFAFGAPIYFLKKLINRMKYHSRFRTSSRGHVCWAIVLLAAQLQSLAHCIAQGGSTV